MESNTALVVIALALLVSLVWAMWYTIGHAARLNREMLEVIDELQLRGWAQDTASSPERVAGAHALMAVSRQQEVPSAAPLTDFGRPSEYPDESLLRGM